MFEYGNRPVLIQLVRSIFTFDIAVNNAVLMNKPLDFGKIGEQMFGPRALPVLRVFALTECFCICSWCLVFVGEAVASFFPLSKSVVINS